MSVAEPGLPYVHDSVLTSEWRSENYMNAGDCLDFELIGMHSIGSILVRPGSEVMLLRIDGVTNTGVTTTCTYGEDEDGATDQLKSDGIFNCNFLNVSNVQFVMLSPGQMVLREILMFTEVDLGIYVSELTIENFTKYNFG